MEKCSDPNRGEQGRREEEGGRENEEGWDREGREGQSEWMTDALGLWLCPLFIRAASLFAGAEERDGGRMQSKKGYERRKSR